MERFPIEPEELLLEEAHQVEVYYQEPQDFAAEFEKKGKHQAESSYPGSSVDRAIREGNPPGSHVARAIKKGNYPGSEVARAIREGTPPGSEVARAIREGNPPGSVSNRRRF